MQELLAAREKEERRHQAKRLVFPFPRERQRRGCPGSGSRMKGVEGPPRKKKEHRKKIYKDALERERESVGGV